MVTVNGHKAVNSVDTMTNAGMILAGGQSLRMGQDKALLNYQGLTLLDYMQQLLKPVTLSHVYISRSDYIADCIADKGPLGGIYSVVQQLPASVLSLLILPIDMPLLKPQLLQNLVDKAQDDPSRAYYYQSTVLPLCLPINEAVKAHLKQAVSSQKTYSIRWLLETTQLEALPLKPEDMPYFANMNTPEQWHDVVKESR